MLQSFSMNVVGRCVRRSKVQWRVSVENLCGFQINSDRHICVSEMLISPWMCFPTWFRGCWGHLPTIRGYYWWSSETLSGRLIGAPVAIRTAALTMSVDTLQGTITYPGEKENHRLKSTDWDQGYVSSQGINHDGLNVVVKYPWMLQA